MPQITALYPETWQDLEELVRSILSESGMSAERQAQTALVRGKADIDVLATETIDGIDQLVVCECKYWGTNVPQAIVHALRTILVDLGANRGYIIARTGFQSGAFEAAKATNVRLLTLEQFQERYFDRWYKYRISAVEDRIEAFNTYYEPLGRPGYNLLTSDAERAAYDDVWDRYAYVGYALHSFSPYIAMLGRPVTPPVLPLTHLVELEGRGMTVPDSFKALKGYREILAHLEAAALEGLAELRRVNPVTRNKPSDQITRED